MICVVEQLSASLSRIHNRAKIYLRAFVDLNCFATGAPLSVILDEAISPDGVIQSLRPIHPTLGQLCTVTNEGGSVQPTTVVTDSKVEAENAEREATRRAEEKKHHEECGS